MAVADCLVLPLWLEFTSFSIFFYACEIQPLTLPVLSQQPAYVPEAYLKSHHRIYPASSSIFGGLSLYS